VTAAAPGGVLRLDAADLVATAGAGATLQEIDDTLASAGVWLALDPPGPRSITLGQALGTGAPGPLAALYGPPRDQVIGLSFAAGDGASVRTGGRVVKNVAGFDLAKLVVGGHGAFGVIGEAHLRLRARPEADLTRAWLGARDDITAAAARMMREGAMLASLEVTSPGFPGADAWSLFARALGTGVGATEELEAAAAVVGAGCTETLTGDSPWPAWRDWASGWPVRARIGADPASWHEAVTLAELFGARDFSATIPRGTVRAGWPAASAVALRDLRAAAAARGWPVTLEHADGATLRAVGIWGALPAGSLPLARKLRAALGPAGTQDIPLWV
jgi:glycolate oxidase FAD binding subunit